MDNLRYIRQTMERAGSFTAVPGVGGILMGCTALVAAWVAGPNVRAASWLTVWLVAAVAAVLIGVAGALVKSRRARQPLLNGPGRKFVAGFTPAIVAGVVLSLALVRAGLPAMLPGVWLLLYGVAVVTGGWASVRVVPMMGACFMAAGVAALFVPGLPANLLLAASFGGIHILFGTVIATNYGG
jgi:hypothetical protein